MAARAVPYCRFGMDAIQKNSDTNNDTDTFNL